MGGGGGGGGGGGTLGRYDSAVDCYTPIVYTALPYVNPLWGGHNSNHYSGTVLELGGGGGGGGGTSGGYVGKYY